MPLRPNVCTALCCFAVLFAILLGPVVQAAAPRMIGNSDPPKGLTSLPLDVWAAVSASVGRDQPAYHARRAGTAITLDNPAHGLKAHFTKRGLDLSGAGARLKLRALGIGYGSKLQPLPAVQPRMSANRVEYHYEGLREWYINGPAGLEQGFTLASPPKKTDR